MSKDSIIAIIAKLSSAGVEVYLHEDKLKARAVKGVLNAELANLIKTNKAGLIDYLSYQAQHELRIKRPKIVALKRESNKLITSFAQQRLWFIDKIDGGSTHYNMPSGMHIDGDFKVDVAETAFTEIINRHESLRTIFIDGDVGPRQLVCDKFNFSIDRIDLSELEGEKQDKAIEAAINKNAEYLFKLNKDLMLKVAYLHLGHEQGVLLLNMHHIASDGWSIGILVDEFVKLYRAELEGNPYPLAPLSIQYADYAHWQRSWLQGDVLESQLDYWDKQLADLPQVHSLPLDYERPVFQTFNGALHDFKVDNDTFERLKTIAFENQATLFMMIHAAFSILLSRYSNNTDIIIGTPVANRLQKELEPLIGFFINTLVLRADCATNLTFTEFLTQIKNTNQDAQANQDVPFEYLVDRLKPDRSTSHNALFQIMLSMNTTEGSELTLPHVSLTPQKKSKVTAKFDLLLKVVTIDNDKSADESKGLHCSFEYNTDLFSAKFMERMANSMQRLLESIAIDATQKIAKLTLLSNKQIHQQLYILNNTQSTYPTELCIHQLFEQQVVKTPNHIALVYEEQSLTYTEFNKRSNQLAHYLIKKGIKPDHIVGLCVERSLEMMIGLMAILKAGGAYLPLDPSYPKDRLVHMVQDSGLSLLLTQHDLVNITDKLQRQQLALDDSELLDLLSDYSSDNPIVAALDSNKLAYVIYTSGSTGLPKGVMVEHQASLNRIDWMQKQYHLTEKDVVLQKTPFSFDVSVCELTWFFTVGAQLVLAVPDGHKDPVYLCDVIQRNQVTMIRFVPSMLRAMLTNKDWANCRSLRKVFCSGEALPLDIPALHYSMNNATLYNLYGPTEAAVEVSHWQVPNTSDTEVNLESHSKKDLTVIPMGKPIQNVQLLVLNAQLEVQPKGSLGELFIGGVGLARGYLNQPKLTAERFIKNNFAAINSERLYRTGDLVRYLDDGNLEFIGRVDHQIKLRGFRIELGEIEHQLSSHPEVNASVMMVREDKPGQKHLVAYFTSDSNDKDTVLINKIRDALQKHLPDYMVPTLYVRLKTIPLGASGKIDRKVLPAPEINLNNTYSAPDGKIEITLTEIWAELLKLPKEKLSTSANFFELGGDSILSIQIVSRAAEAGLRVTIKQLFEHQSIQSLAPHLVPIKVTKASQAATVGKQLLLPIQHHFFTNEKGLSHYNQAVLLKTPENFNLTLLTLLIKQLYKRHDVLRLRFIKKQDQWQGSYKAFDSKMLSQSISQVQLDETGFKQLPAKADIIQASLNLNDGPLFRVAYYRDKLGEGRLLLIFHHLIIDGVSWRIILDDMERLYQQSVDLQVLSLRSKSTSYQQWACFLYDYSCSDTLKAEKDYWLQMLKETDVGLPQQNVPEPKENGFGHLHIEWSETLTEQLLSKAPSAYSTQINELLLAALLLGFHQWSGHQSLTIDMEGHGRQELTDDLDLSQTIGWFTTIYPLNLMSHAMDPQSIICTVKELCRSIPNHGIGFGILKYLTKEKAILESQSPSVLFNYLGQFSHNEDVVRSFPMTNEGAGQSVSNDRKPNHGLNFNGAISQNRLSFSLSFDQSRYQTEAIEQFSNEIKKALVTIVDHCLEPENGCLTPSDFPLARFNQQRLDQLQQNNEIEDIYPATAMQQGLLYHSLLDQSAYTSQLLLTLDAGINLKSLNFAWQQMIDRHSILRTAFVSNEHSEIHQMVLSQVDMPWIEHHIEHLDESAQRQQIEKNRLADKARGFETTKAPLLRITIWHLGNDRYRMLLTNHHAILDGWSFPLLFSEVMSAYQGHDSGEPLAFEKPVSYRHYIQWLSEQDTKQAKIFWQQELKGIKGASILGKRMATDVTESQQERQQKIHFSVAETVDLEKLAQNNHVTLNIILQAAWGYLLSRYTNEQTVVFGTTVSGRPANLSKVEQMIGLFINTIPVRIDVPTEMTVNEWLKNLHSKQVARDEYNYLPLVDIHSLSELNHDVALIDSLLIFENYPIKENDTESGQNEQMTISELNHHEEANYNFSIIAVNNKSLQIKLAAKGHLITDAELQQLSGHLKTIVLSMITQQQVRQLTMLSKKEHHYLLHTVNNTKTDYAKEFCIHQVFEQQVKKYPNNIAVVFEGQALTYSELNTKANQLAHYLIEKVQGNSADSIIGLCFERSLDMMVALMAILKSGAAYLPLDPNYPKARLEYMIEDSRLSLLITQQHLTVMTDGIIDGDSKQCVILDDQQLISTLANYSSNNLIIEGLSADNLAYVIYTSGSTGQPKGVMNEHKALHNLCQWHKNEYQVTADKTASHLASIGFDAAVWEIWPYLISGARVQLISDQIRLSPDELLKTFKQNKVTHCFLPTALLEASFELFDSAEPTPLEFILTGGDKLTKQGFVKYHNLLG